MPPSSPQSARRAFTLIELLTVILIIVIVISIVLPALGQVRRSARKTETTTQLNALNSAISKYIIDTKRTPGYFSAADMGSLDNETEGFSTMQNIMLDLAGGVVKDGTTGEVKVGPRNALAEKVSVLPENVGLQTAGQNIYFTPTAKSWRNIPQDVAAQSDFGFRASTVANARLNELVDAFGTPILAWSIDDTVRTPITGPIPGPAGALDQFARRNSGAAADQKSRFYWASNAAFLTAGTAVGKLRRDQADSGRGSIVESGLASPNLERNMMGLFGNPSSPLGFVAATPVLDVRPSGARGRVILHSAGEDGYYFSKADRTPRRVPGGVVNYGYAHKVDDATILTDSQGRTTSEDLLTGFDDIVQAAN